MRNEFPISKMIYSEKCKKYSVSQTMEYFRAILKIQEVSIRAFELTSEVIHLSSGFYAAWHYRRFLFNQLQLDLQSELNFLSECAQNNPKNYQVWHYRKELLNQCEDYASELSFTDEILAIDERNVHAWGFRQWVTLKFNLWNEELIFVDN